MKIVKPYKFKVEGEIYDIMESNVVGDNFKVEILKSDFAPKSRKVKEKDFDFLMVDSFDVMGSDKEYGTKLRNMDVDKYKEEVTPQMVEALNYAKGLLKTAPKGAQWLVGVNPFTLSTYSMDVFGAEETKRVNLVELSNSFNDPHNFGSELNWFMWGTTGKNWGGVKYDLKGEDGMALDLGEEFPEEEYIRAKEEGRHPKGYYKWAKKKRDITEPAFLGWFKYDSTTTYQEKVAKQILYRYTNPGDTIAVLKLHEDDVFIKIALAEGRNVAVITVPFSIDVSGIKVKPVHSKNNKVKRKYLKKTKNKQLSEEVGVAVNTIEHSDCYDYLHKIKDGTIDVLISDVPYNISMENGSGNGPYMNGKVGLDFGDWDMGQFIVEDFIEEVTPKLTETGQVVIFNSYTNMETMAWKLHELGYTVKGIYTWVKPNPVPHMPKLWALNSFEQFIWAVKDEKQYTLNVRETFKDSEDSVEDGTFVFSPHEDLKHRFHTTQKPLGLMEAVVQVFSNKGDIVLDSFMGSGSTADASQQQKRYFVGSELDDTYFKKATERLNKSQNKPKGLF